MHISSKFEHDFKTLRETFPKLHYTKAERYWRIEGELDICDFMDNYWGTFEIITLVPHGYPYCVPLLYEKSKIIPRNIDHHINEDGFCCVDITHKLLFRSKRGITLFTFFTEWVYPYFANQLFHNIEKKYAGEEYAHHFGGVEQFYQEDMLLNREMAKKMLQAIIEKKGTSRNNPCPCGSGKKLKRCHLQTHDFLKSLGPVLLRADLQNFQSRIDAA